MIAMFTQLVGVLDDLSSSHVDQAPPVLMIDSFINDLGPKAHPAAWHSRMCCSRAAK
jgi:hypothetical protein